MASKLSITKALRPMSAQVLLVDDDPAVRAALQFRLELEGFVVNACSSGEELLDRQDLPKGEACLVLDYKLTGMTGLETLQRLRDRHVNLPALLITSNPAPVLRAAAGTAGATIVEKPLLGDDLVGEIRAALLVGAGRI